MKAILCNKIGPNSPEYFNIGWKVPYDHLEKLGWRSLEQKDNFWSNNFSTVLFWNVNSWIKNNWDKIMEAQFLKMIYFDDIHQKKSIAIFRRKIINHFDRILATYAYLFPRVFSDVPKVAEKVVWLPHFIRDEFWVPYQPDPLPRILLSGTIEPNIYPFRYQVSQMTHNYPIDILPHMGYRKQRHDIIGHKYIEHLSRYLVGFTCCSNESYLLAKFFEIPASGALLLAYEAPIREQLQALGFIEGKNYLAVDTHNLRERIQYVLDPKNRPVINQIRQQGYQLVWSKHKMSDRARLIDSIS
jgi:hypothetical protein